MTSLATVTVAGYRSMGRNPGTPLDKSSTVDSFHNAYASNAKFLYCISPGARPAWEGLNSGSQCIGRDRVVRYYYRKWHQLSIRVEYLDIPYRTQNEGAWQASTLPEEFPSLESPQKTPSSNTL